jgi:serine/threonine protein kinase
MNYRQLLTTSAFHPQSFFTNYVLHNLFSILSMASSSPLLKLGQRLTGTLSTYTVTKQLGEFLWLGRYTSDRFCILRRYQIIAIFVLTCLSRSNKIDQTVVIKSARHFRITNERDVLRTFQSKTPHLRPLIDEIVEPADPPAIVLKYLENDLLSASNAKRLSGREIRYVSKRVLETLKVLHEDGYVHTGRDYAWSYSL